MDNNIFDLYAKRHSFYNITNDCPLTAEEIENLVQKSLELYPSPFNSQSARAMVLFGKNHKNLWSITQTELLKAAPKEKAQAISDKIASFANGHGTILYFTDTDVTRALQNKFPLYAANFDNWAYQCNAILQFMVWTALANSDIGANLQHYNPLIDDAVRQAFNIPNNWELVAQMPFGGIGATPQAHSVENIKEKFIIKT